MRDEQSIHVAAVDEATLLGGDRLWQRVDLATLRENLDQLLGQLHRSLPSGEPDPTTGFCLTQIQVAVAVGAKGQVGILGTGAELSGQASLTLTLQRQAQA